jgi:RNA polymerase sigma-B factor
MGSGAHRAEAQEAGSEAQSSSHSGRLLVRMPQTLHAELAAAAEREQVSLNQFITGALAAAVRWRQPSRNGAAQATPDPPARGVEPLPGPDPARRSTRMLSLALTVNAVLVAIAAVVAIGLLIAAWS